MSRRNHRIRLRCAICRRKFLAFRTSAMYCSPKCRKAAQRERERKKMVANINRMVADTNLGTMAEAARRVNNARNQAT